MIFDLRPLKQASGIDETDVAKRLMDYGFHAPTVSFPVAGTLMVEPTESEPKDELDRFCDAMIRDPRRDPGGRSTARPIAKDNVLKNAPHTAAAVSADDWTHPYSREQAAFPLPFVRAHKFWPSVGRIDNPYGDRNLMCSCPPVETLRVTGRLNRRPSRSRRSSVPDACVQPSVRAMRIRARTRCAKAPCSARGHRPRRAGADRPIVDRDDRHDSRASCW